jgi:hypothetical protein
MKKLLVILLITVSVSGLLFPAVRAYAQEPTEGEALAEAQETAESSWLGNLADLGLSLKDNAVKATCDLKDGVCNLAGNVLETGKEVTGECINGVCTLGGAALDNAKCVVDATGGWFCKAGEATWYATKAVAGTVGKVVAAPFKAVYGAAKAIYAAVNCITSPIQCIQLAFVSVIQWVGNIILGFVSWVLWLCGIVFNLSIIVFVIHMKDLIDKISVIFTVWQTIRDLANMFFIFILLVIAIQTILGSGNYKKMLTNVVLAALFINFSFFFTGVIIDASNVTALQFYNGFATKDCEATAATGVLQLADGCMSYRIVEALSIKTLYEDTQNASSTGVGGAVSSIANAAIFVAAPGTGALSGIAKLVIAVVMGSVLMIIVSVIFLVSGLLLIYRFVELIFLLMFSPLAFAFMVLPSTKKYATEWWDRLINQVVFAPVYFMFLWVVMTIITGNDGHSVLKTVLSVQDASFLSLFDGSNIMGMFGLIANYVIVIVLMWYSLALAKKLGATGSEQVMKAAGSIKGWAGRNTAGRAASRVMNSQGMKDFRRDHPTAGRLAQAPFKAAANYGFGGAKGGFETAQKNYLRDEEEFAKALGPDPIKLRKAELELEEHKKAQETAKEQAEAPFKAREEKIEADLKTAKEQVEKAEKEAGGYAGFATKTKEGRDAQKKLDDSRAELTRLNEEKARLTKDKDTAVGRATGPFESRRKAAQNEMDRLNGVNAEEANKRATKAVLEDPKNKDLSKEEIREAIKEQAKEIMDANKGVLKENQKIFSKAVEDGFGKVAAKIVPTKMGKKVMENAINVVIFDKKTRTVAASNLRKLYKEKPVKDKLLDDLKKAFKDTEGEGEKKGEEKKEEKKGEEKPKD